MYPPETRAKLIAMVTEEGQSATAAAATVGISYRCAISWLHAAGVKLTRGHGGGTRNLRLEKRMQVLRLVASGMTRKAVAIDMGLAYCTVKRWCKDTRMTTHDLRQQRARARIDDTIVSLQATIKQSTRQQVGRGKRLIPAQRQVIAIADAAGHSQEEIAEMASTSKSTVSRELARVTGGRGAYLSDAGEKHARRRLRRPRLRKLDANPHLRAEVITGLNKGWSPRLIALELAQRFGNDETMTISAETIYQSLYVQGKGTLRQELTIEKALHTGRARRRPRSQLPERRGNKSWIDGAHISQRPAQADDRSVPGHWEGDLIIGSGGQSAIITLVERSSRYLMMRRLPLDHTSPTVVPIITDMIGTLPEHLRASLTWDQGPEMARHAEFTVATDCSVFFCDPHSPWQRGSNENTNGLIRRFLPKGTDFRQVSDERIAEIEMLLNTRPRETLNLMTPADKLNENIGVASTA